MIFNIAGVCRDRSSFAASIVPPPEMIFPENCYSPARARAVAASIYVKFEFDRIATGTRLKVGESVKCALWKPVPRQVK